MELFASDWSSGRLWRLRRALRFTSHTLTPWTPLPYDEITSSRASSLTAYVRGVLTPRNSALTWVHWSATNVIPAWSCLQTL
jgi:hypothetical protein